MQSRPPCWMPHIGMVNHIHVVLRRGRGGKAWPDLLDRRLKIRIGDHHNVVAALLQCQSQTYKGIDITETSQRQEENAHDFRDCVSGSDQEEPASRTRVQVIRATR